MNIAAAFLEDAKSWIQDCTHKHEECDIDQIVQSKRTKLRVIDCHATRNVNKRLTVVDAPAECEYFALSYVWGADKASPTLDGRLPQTIEDSITTVLRLGYNYLWVDRCVRIASHDDMMTDYPSASSRLPKTNTIKYSRWARYMLGHV